MVEVVAVIAHGALDEVAEFTIIVWKPPAVMPLVPIAGRTVEQGVDEGAHSMNPILSVLETAGSVAAVDVRVGLPANCVVQVSTVEVTGPVSAGIAEHGKVPTVTSLRFTAAVSERPGEPVMVSEESGLVSATLGA
jgi:hypothetical protein